MTLSERVIQARRDGDFAPVIAGVPYFELLGLKVQNDAQRLTIVLPGDERHTGRTSPPFIHGGVIGALLEATALLQLLAADTTHVAKTISITTDYLRSARLVDTQARAQITRMGRRVANVRIEAWQDDPARPVAQAHGHFLLV